MVFPLLPLTFSSSHPPALSTGKVCRVRFRRSHTEQSDEMLGLSSNSGLLLGTVAPQQLT